MNTNPEYLIFNLKTWKNYDIFDTKDTLWNICTPKVKSILEKHKITNLKFIPKYIGFEIDEEMFMQKRWDEEIPTKDKFIDINKNTTKTDVAKNTGEFTPTRIKVSSRLSVTEGLNKDRSDLAFYNELPISYISTTGVSDEDSAVFAVEGVVKDIVDELNSNGGTTGRYIIDLVVPNFFGVDIFNLVMLDKWNNNIDGEEVEFTKEMFYNANDTENSFCKAGDTVKLSGDIEGHSFGSVATVSDAKKTFGGGAKSVRSGFTRIEWTVKSGDFVEDSEQYDTAIIAKALEEREITLDNHYKQRLEDYKNMNAGKAESKPSVKGSANGGTSPFGGSAPKSSPFGNAKKSPFG